MHFTWLCALILRVNLLLSKGQNSLHDICTNLISHYFATNVWNIKAARRFFSGKWVNPFTAFWILNCSFSISNFVPILFHHWVPLANGVFVVRWINSLEHWLSCALYWWILCKISCRFHISSSCNWTSDLRSYWAMLTFNTNLKVILKRLPFSF